MNYHPTSKGADFIRLMSILQLMLALLCSSDYHVRLKVINETPIYACFGY